MATVVDKDEDSKNYYAVLGINKNKERVFKDSHNKFIKFVYLGAGIGGGFANTQELQVMEYHEAINGSDGELWKAEVVKEHQRMIDSGVFEPVKMSKVPEGVKLNNMTWAIKKKNSGTLCGRVNVSGFKQINEQHYNGTCISAPVTNAMTIRIVLVIMLM